MVTHGANKCRAVAVCFSMTAKERLLNNRLLGALCCVALASACEDYNSLTNSYVVMTDDLAELKADFNESVDQVRLVFIVGPS